MIKKKKKKQKGRKLSAGELRNAIVRLFERHPKKRLNAKQIIKKLKITNNKDAVSHALTMLAEKQILFPLDGLKYRLDRNARIQSDRQTHTGQVDMTRTGAGYIICKNLEEDVFVPAARMGGALHGDKVEIAVWLARGRYRPEGEVLKVLERANEQFIGTLHLKRKYGIVIPDKLNMPVDIYVDLDNLNGASDNEKVIVEIIKWPGKSNKSPIGIITYVLGEVGSNEIEMKSILLNNGFNLEFPQAVLKQSDALPSVMTEEEIENRRDMRMVPTFTIDPENAKDFDDALSLQQLDNGDWEVGVHIADVTYYVRPNTALDKEAYKRSTSVYLVDRVLPMLPEKLSNELCSLRPNEDKFTFSAVFTFDEKGKVTRRWFGKTVIHSDCRFSYEEAQEVLETGEGSFSEELKVLNNIAKILRKKKFKNGAIAFEADEVNFRLDEDGTPIEVYVKERKDAHLLIEDFMLLANREVATYIAKKGKKHEIPFVYRIHDLPDPDKVADFFRFAGELGFKMKGQTPRQVAEAYNNLAKAARKDPALKILEPIAIRTMAKAEYSTDNIGHYGLGFEFYTHFTSPIRRYSDVLAHRILEKNLTDIHRENKEYLEEKCQHISRQERKAMDAERESVKYKQVEYIEKHVGESFYGIISGIIDRGIFVELEDSKCEGMVAFNNFPEAFNIEEGRLKAVGVRSGKILRMGDRIKVRILNADLSRRQIEMELVGV